MGQIRKIIHIDMDAFFASVEEREDSSLKGKAIVVGGDPYHRGVVSTCSYEARKYGIHSAMPSKTAYHLCPQAVFIRPRIELYQEVSYEIRRIFKEYTDRIEPLSIDEAFLDVTENKKGLPSATAIAQSIKQEILVKTGLTASAGISYNKFLAKLASDYQKPNGLTIITSHNAQDILDKLPIERFYGVGKVTSSQLKKIGIHTGADLKKLSLEYLISAFNKKGHELYNFARGIDERPVQPNRIRKSVGAETTFNEDLIFEPSLIKLSLDPIIAEVAMRLEESGKCGKTVTLKIKYEDFRQITRSITSDRLVYRYEDIKRHIEYLIDKLDKEQRKVRLLGVSISHCEDRGAKRHINLSLFDEEFADRLL